jgi:uroporphyrinogen decarboxylase
MRQAGRYLPEYRAIREKADFLTMCKTPELAAEVTVQPVEIIGVDAAILFSDILVIPEAMGMKLNIEEGTGPRLEDPIRCEADIERLAVPDPAEKLKYALDAIGQTKKALANRVPLIGFAGAPWTLFAYMVEGNGAKDHKQAKVMLYSEPQLAHKLLEQISRAVALFLKAQIEAGADVVQLFDTWAGLLSYDQLRNFSLRYVRQIIEEVKSEVGERVPIILFSKGTSAWVDDLLTTGCDVVSVDWTCDLGSIKEAVGGRAAVQGNLDPVALLSKPESLVAEAKAILRRVGPGGGHIFNLGHGILPDTPVENAKLLVETVKSESGELYL